MDRLVSRERDLEMDIESGGTTSEEDRANDLVLANQQNNTLLNNICSGLLCFDGSMNSSNLGELDNESVEMLIDKNSEEEGQQHVAFVGKKRVEEKRKKRNPRKPPKPPRPPKGPSLDAADQKLVQEITELAVRKRARMERIKALKKMRAAKTSSRNGSLLAMVITLLFLLVIIIQGICSRNSGSIQLQGSPEPAVAGGEDLISVQIYNFSAYEDGSGSGIPSSGEGRVPGSGLRKR